jgi:hypothetical protein
MHTKAEKFRQAYQVMADLQPTAFESNNAIVSCRSDGGCEVYNKGNYQARIVMSDKEVERLIDWLNETYRTPIQN